MCPSVIHHLIARSARATSARAHTDLEHRVIYVAKFEEGVYVLHAFEKKSRKTLKSDIELARARLSAFLWTREQTRARRRQRGKPS